MTFLSYGPGCRASVHRAVREYQAHHRGVCVKACAHHACAHDDRFADLTAVTPVGQALAVVEMLIGQPYLVTVIGVIVGDFVGRSRA